MTRKGKIARLPRAIRDELNRRLDEGKEGIQLVKWLNAQPEVKQVLRASFGGRPITEQNLSDWKQGGYLDWQDHQESREMILILADEADQMEDDSGLMQMSDRVSSMAVLALAKIIRELGPKAKSDTASREGLLRVLRELTRLRRDDHNSARMLDRNYHNARLRQTYGPKLIPGAD